MLDITQKEGKSIFRSFAHVVESELSDYMIINHEDDYEKTIEKCRCAIINLLIKRFGFKLVIADINLPTKRWISLATRSLNIMDKYERQYNVTDQSIIKSKAVHIIERII